MSCRVVSCRVGSSFWSEVQYKQRRRTTKCGPSSTTPRLLKSLTHGKQTVLVLTGPKKRVDKKGSKKHRRVFFRFFRVQWLLGLLYPLANPALCLLLDVLPTSPQGTERERSRPDPGTDKSRQSMDPLGVVLGCGWLDNKKRNPAVLTEPS